MSAPWFESPKGTERNPLTLADLPFTVPAAGRYWINYGAGAVQLPHSPEGSVLALEVERRAASSHDSPEGAS